MPVNYERELKDILGGDESMIDKISRNLSQKAIYNYRSFCKKPFFVIRAAGSFGVDLIALREELSMLIEVKSSKDAVFRFTSESSRAMKQAEYFRKIGEKFGISIIYAFRLKGLKPQRSCNTKIDTWKIFKLFLAPCLRSLPSNSENFERVPEIDKTRAGNLIMRWSDGMELNEFLSLTI